MAKLTDKQKLFCKYYLINLNATDAAIKAGYSKKTAKDIGCENLAKPNIQEYIQKAMDKRAEKIEITADKVIQEIAKLAFSNASDFMEIDQAGRIGVKDLTQLDTTFIAGAKESFDKDGIFTGVELKFHDKTKNLDMLMRHLGLVLKHI